MSDPDRTTPRARERRLRPHPFEKLRVADDLCSHLVADHGYEAGRFPGVGLLHQVIDIAIGVLWTYAYDERRDAARTVTARLDLENQRLTYLSTDHTMDHD